MTATISKSFLPNRTANLSKDTTLSNMVTGKDIDGNEKSVERTQAYQMTLFQYFLPKENNKYSNSIELYDVAPKYFASSVLLASLRRDTEFGSYLPTLERKFIHRGQSYSIEITPGSIKEPLRDGFMYTTQRYPMEREQLVEEALRKIACERENGIFLDNQAGVQFNLKSLQRELKARGHSINYPDLIESLIICHTTNIAIKSADGKKVVSSTLFPVLLFCSRKDWLEDPQNAKFFIQFNPLVTESIRTLTYRQFDYELFMKLRSPLARWLYKRLSHHFINADGSNLYTILASTIIRDSGLVNCKRMTDSLKQIKHALDELKAFAVIHDIKIEKDFNGKSIMDAKYNLAMGYSNFINQMKIANSRRKEQIALAHKDNKLQETIHKDKSIYCVLD